MSSGFSLLCSKKKTHNAKSPRQVEFYLEDKKHEKTATTAGEGGVRKEPLHQVASSKRTDTMEGLLVSDSKWKRVEEGAPDGILYREVSSGGTSGSSFSPVAKGRVIITEDENNNPRQEVLTRPEGMEIGLEGMKRKSRGKGDAFRNVTSFSTPPPGCTSSAIPRPTPPLYTTNSHSFNLQGEGKEKKKSTASPNTLASFSDGRGAVEQGHSLPSTYRNPDPTSCSSYPFLFHQEWDALSQRGVMRCIDTGNLPSAIEEVEIANDYYLKLLKRSSLNDGGSGAGSGGSPTGGGGNAELGKKPGSQHEAHLSRSASEGSRHRPEEHRASRHKRNGQKGKEKRKKHKRGRSASSGKKRISSSSRKRSGSRDHGKKTAKGKRSSRSTSTTHRRSQSRSTSRRGKRSSERKEKKRTHSSGPLQSSTHFTGSQSGSRVPTNVTPAVVLSRSIPSIPTRVAPLPSTLSERSKPSASFSHDVAGPFVASLPVRSAEAKLRQHVGGTSGEGREAMFRSERSGVESSIRTAVHEDGGTAHLASAVSPLAPSGLLAYGAAGEHKRRQEGVMAVLPPSEAPGLTEPLEIPPTIPMQPSKPEDALAEQQASSFLTSIDSYKRESLMTIHATSPQFSATGMEYRQGNESKLVSTIPTIRGSTSSPSLSPRDHVSQKKVEHQRGRSSSHCSSCSDTEAGVGETKKGVSFDTPEKKKSTSSTEKGGSGVAKKKKKKSSPNTSIRQPVSRAGERTSKSGSDKLGGKTKGRESLVPEPTAVVRGGNNNARLAHPGNQKGKPLMGKGIGKRGGVDITQLCLRKINPASFEGIKEKKKKVKVMSTECLRAYEDGVRMFEAEYTAGFAHIEKMFRETSFEPQTRELLRLVEGIQFVRMDCEQKLGLAETVVNTLITGVENLIAAVHKKGSSILKEDETLVCDKELDGTEASVSKAKGEPLPEVRGVLELLRDPIHPPSNTMALTEESKKGIDHFFRREFDFIQDNRLQLRKSLIVPFFDDPSRKRGVTAEDHIAAEEGEDVRIASFGEEQAWSRKAGTGGGEGDSSSPATSSPSTRERASIIVGGEDQRQRKRGSTRESVEVGRGRKGSKTNAKGKRLLSSSSISSATNSRRSTIRKGSIPRRRRSSSGRRKRGQDGKHSHRSTRTSTMSSASSRSSTRRSSSLRSSPKRGHDRTLGSHKNRRWSSGRKKMSHSASFYSSPSSPSLSSPSSPVRNGATTHTAVSAHGVPPGGGERNGGRGSEPAPQDRRAPVKPSPLGFPSSGSFFSPTSPGRRSTPVPTSVPSADFAASLQYTRKSFAEVARKYADEVKAYSAFTNERTDTIQNQMALLTSALEQLMTHVARRHDLYRKKILSQQRLLDETATHRKLAADVLQNQKESETLSMETIDMARSLGSELRDRMDKVEREMRETVQKALQDSAIVSHEQLAYRDYSTLAEKKAQVKEHVICRMERSMLDQAEIMRDLQYLILDMWTKSHPKGREEHNTLVHRSIPTPYEKILQRCGKDTLLRVIHHLTLNNDEALRLLIGALDEHEHFLSTNTAEAQAAREDEATQTAVRALLFKMHTEGRIHCNPCKTSNSLTESIQSMVEQYNAFTAFTENYARALLRRERKRQTKTVSTPFFHHDAVLPAVLQAIQEQHLKLTAASGDQKETQAGAEEKVVPGFVKRSPFFSGHSHKTVSHSHPNALSTSPALTTAVGAPSPPSFRPSSCTSVIGTSHNHPSLPVKTPAFTSSLPPVHSTSFSSSTALAHSFPGRSTKEIEENRTNGEDLVERNPSRGKNHLPVAPLHPAAVKTALEKAHPSISDPLVAGISVVGYGRWDGRAPAQRAASGGDALSSSSQPNSMKHTLWSFRKGAVQPLVPSPPPRQYSAITRALEAEAASKELLVPGAPARKMLQEYILETHNHSSDELGQLMAALPSSDKTMKKYNNPDIPFLEKRNQLFRELEQSVK